MSSNASQAPTSLDPGKPIDTIPSYFWAWVEAVRVYWAADRRATPLNSTVDFYPIINRFYRPKPDSIRANPSVYITNMRKAGLIRRFGPEFHVPEVEITIRVRGEIVYVPGDLDALLAGDERFLAPNKDAVQEDQVSEEPDEAEEESEQEVVQAAEQVAEEEEPAAEQPSTQKARTRRANPKQKQVDERLAKILWAVAEPTDDPVWRVMTKSAAMEHVVRECGNSMYYARIYLSGHLKSGGDYGTCLVRDPSHERGSLPSEPEVESPESDSPATASIDSSILDVEALKRKLCELEARYDTLTEEARSHADDLRRQVQTLDETITALKQEQREYSDRIERLILGKQQDQEILDLHWAIANHDRLMRVMGKA